MTPSEITEKRQALLDKISEARALHRKMNDVLNEMTKLVKDKPPQDN